MTDLDMNVQDGWRLLQLNDMKRSFMALMVEGITSEKTLADMNKMMDDYKK
jgi:hypothetical protein